MSPNEKKYVIKMIMQNEDLEIDLFTLYTHDCFIETLQMLDSVDVPMHD
jgi:hypothetical protein